MADLRPLSSLHEPLSSNNNLSMYPQNYSVAEMYENDGITITPSSSSSAAAQPPLVALSPSTRAPPRPIPLVADSIAPADASDVSSGNDQTTIINVSPLDTLDTEDSSYFMHALNVSPSPSPVHKRASSAASSPLNRDRVISAAQHRPNPYPPRTPSSGKSSRRTSSAANKSLFTPSTPHGAGHHHHHGSGHPHVPAHPSPHHQRNKSNSSPRHVVPSTSNPNLKQENSSWKHLINLNGLLAAGFISQEEYEERKRQLIDSLTGTTNNKQSQSRVNATGTSAVTGTGTGAGTGVAAQDSVQNITNNNNNNVGSKHITNENSIVAPDSSSKIAKYLNDSNKDAHVEGHFNPYHDIDRPPEYNHTETKKRTTIAANTLATPHPPLSDSQWGEIQSEYATKYTYDLRNQTWTTSRIEVKLDTVPFSHGALRLCYHLLDLSPEGQRVSQVHSKVAPDGTVAVTVTPISWVAKISMDIRDHINKEIYFRDVETQSLARYYAKLYNQHNPPKCIEFVKASILRLEERQGKPFCAVERYIDGEYKKFNNNYGYQHPDERNTPEAFSHFSYESSQHRILVCDIQGIGDIFTDPQIHSQDRKGFGKGNLGQKGIDKFLSTHRCNPICRYLKLPSINANYTDYGTLPLGEYMSFESIKIVNIAQFPRIGTGQRIASSQRTITCTMPPLLNKNSPSQAKAKHVSPASGKFVDYEEHDFDAEDSWCSGFFGTVFCNIM